jgi:asparagine synthase (glutamine-hydrolysing)
MCGITGFVEKNSTPAAPFDREQLIARMCTVMSHRGPDDQGTMVDDTVALGMRRLSIIDLAGGHQPMTSSDGEVTIVFNGEIYNYRELRQHLQSKGYQFRTKSDTESILHSYEEYGDACVDQLRGMFAFALWDGRRRKLLIARDRVGEKPLYYSVTDHGTVVFGSEIKCLLQHPEVSREIDPVAVDAYLTFGYIPDPLSIFKGISKLPPGHLLTVSVGKIHIKQYWDFPHEESSDLTEQQYIDELRERLQESVRMRLVSDVPLGAFLSGGVDSSTIVAFMTREMSEPVKTFSIGFKEDSYDELKYARMVANRFGTDHHELIVTPDVCGIIDKLICHFDEPFADQSVIPTYYVSKLARDHVTVVLSGDGGDELFAGYTRYAVDLSRQRFERLPRFFRDNVMRSLSERMPHGARGRNYLYNVALNPIERYIDNISVFTTLNRASLYSRQFIDSLAETRRATDIYRDFAQQVKAGDQIDRLLYLDSKTYLPGDILTKVDRMSMAVSLEARVPLLDHELIEFVARMPSSLKMKGNEAKYIFKRAIKGIVPDEILTRPKQGFGVPIGTWINDQLKERIHDTLRDSVTRQRGYLRGEYIDVLLDEHERGRRDHAPALWTVLVLELWFRMFVDGTQPLSPDTESTFIPVGV